MDEKNKMLFASPSYNADPARISPTHRSPEARP
jgi:hypothetical protein